MIQMHQNGFSTEARGVEYFLRVDILGRFEVTSQRKTLRAARMGGSVRYFNTLAEVEAGVKAFAGIGTLLLTTPVAEA